MPSSWSSPRIQADTSPFSRSSPYVTAHRGLLGFRVQDGRTDRARWQDAAMCQTTGGAGQGVWAARRRARTALSLSRSTVGRQTRPTQGGGGLCLNSMSIEHDRAPD